MSTDWGQMSGDNQNKYPDEELTYKLIGLAFEVYNHIGSGLPEKAYQAAYEKELQSAEIHFRRELYCNLLYKNSKVGRYFIDFLIEDKVALEMKARGKIFDKDIAQLLGYMKIKKIKIGLIILFGEKGVEKKRLIL